jgi:hypothetical protein
MVSFTGVTGTKLATAALMAAGVGSRYCPAVLASSASPRPADRALDR